MWRALKHGFLHRKELTITEQLYPHDIYNLNKSPIRLGQGELQKKVRLGRVNEIEWHP